MVYGIWYSDMTDKSFGDSFLEFEKVIEKSNIL